MAGCLASRWPWPCDRFLGSAGHDRRTVTRPGVMCQGSLVLHDAGMAHVAPGLESTSWQRWLARLSFVLAGTAIVILVVAFRDLLWIAVLSAAVWLLAGITARLALAGNQPDWRVPEHPAQPPARHPYLIMNPKSGGGKVGKFDLKRKAEDLGAQVFLIGGPEPVDVAKGR